MRGDFCVSFEVNKVQNQSFLLSFHNLVDFHQEKSRSDKFGHRYRSLMVARCTEKNRRTDELIIFGRLALTGREKSETYQPPALSAFPHRNGNKISFSIVNCDSTFFWKPEEHAETLNRAIAVNQESTPIRT